MKNSAKVTPREQEVLHLIAHEHSTKEIASKLYVSYETVNSHRKNLLRKMDVKNTAGLVRVAFERGLMKVSFVLILTIQVFCGLVAQIGCGDITINGIDITQRPTVIGGSTVTVGSNIQLDFILSILRKDSTTVEQIVQFSSFPATFDLEELPSDTFILKGIRNNQSCFANPGYIGQMIVINPPSNDQWFNATSLSVASIDESVSDDGIYPFSNIEAMSTIGEPQIPCAFSNDQNQATVWFEFDAPTSKTVDIKVQLGTMADSQLSLYAVSDTIVNPTFSNFNLIACSEDINDLNFSSFIERIELPDHHSYYIQIDGYNSDMGTFDIYVQEACPFANTLPDTMRWTGLVSNVWTDSCNWDIGIPPTNISKHIVIPDTDNDPTSVVSIYMGGKTLTVESGAHLTVLGYDTLDGGLGAFGGGELIVDEGAELIIQDVKTVGIELFDGSLSNRGRIETDKGIWNSSGASIIENNGEILLFGAMQGIILNDASAIFTNHPCGFISVDGLSNMTIYDGTFNNNGLIHYLGITGDFDIEMSNTSLLYDPNNQVSTSAASQPPISYPMTYMDYTGDFDGDGTTLCSGDLDDFCNESYVVTSYEDAGPGSLRQVIECAPPGQEITFDASINGEKIFLFSGPIEITKDLTIRGNGSHLTRINGSINNNERLLEISNGAKVLFKEITMEQAGSSSTATSGIVAKVSGQGSSARFASCTFDGNQSNEKGAILSAVNAELFLVSNTFKNNISVDSSIIATDNGSFLECHQNLFYDNIGLEIIRADSSMNMINNTFTENDVDSQVVFIEFGGRHRIYQNIFYNNNNSKALKSNSLAYFTEGNLCDFPGDMKDVEFNVNIVGDPMFIDPSLKNFGLEKGSPAIQGGVNGYVQGDSLDIDDDLIFDEKIPIDLNGENRLVFSKADIGAIEYISYACDNMDTIQCGQTISGDNTGDLQLMVPYYDLFGSYSSYPYSDLYEFVPNVSGPVTISLSNVQIDVGDLDIDILQGSDPCDPQRITGGDSEIVDVILTAGETYYIYVLSWQQAQGTYDLTVTCFTDCSSDYLFSSPNNEFAVSKSYVTDGSIESSNLISQNSDITYNAQSGITLAQGFSIELGSELLIKSDGCD